MIYTTHYKSPVGSILLASKDNKLIGLWIEGQKYYLSNLKEEIQENDKEEILIEAKNWLDKYFNHEKTSIKDLELNPIGSDFRQQVWKMLCDIPYGEVITYNDISKEIAKQRGIKRMSAQAVGGAVGHNPISIIIPCHRVVGTNGNVTVNGRLPSTQETKTMSEVIGFDRYKYRNESYVQLKYYNGDINVEGIIDSEALPLDVKNEFIKIQPYNENLKTTIVIDGIEYVRKDSIESTRIIKSTKKINI